MEKLEIKNFYSSKQDVEEFERKEIESIKNDKEFYEIIKSLGDEKNVVTLRLVKENIGILSDYHHDYNICKSCPGYESCPKELKHSIIRYILKGNEFKKEIDLCHLEKEKFLYDSCFIYNDFPSNWSNVSLENIAQDKERKEATKFFLSMLNHKANLMYLKGDIGVGKSYIALAFLNKYLEVNKYNTKVAFVSCNECFKELSDKDHSYKEEDKEYFADAIEALSNVSFLVLDGFGSELKSAFVRDAIIFPILSNRRKENLLTIITSNYSVDEIGEMYSFSKRLNPSAKLIVDTIRYLSNNKEIEINTNKNLFK